jgi:hypothetical protein
MKEAEMIRRAAFVTSATTDHLPRGDVRSAMYALPR